MASEKRTSVSFSVVVGGVTLGISASKNEDLSGTNAQGQIQTIPTAWTAVDVSLLASVDLICVRNNDATNYVQLAIANDGTKIFGRLLPGRACYLPLEVGAVLYAKANTASCDLQVVAVEP